MKRISQCAAVMLVILMCAPAVMAAGKEKGFPEVTIYNATRKDIIDAIVAAKLAKGMKIKSVSDYSIVVGKPVENVMAEFWYGTSLRQYPESRITYNIVEVNGAIKIYSRLELVSNPDTNVEDIRDYTENRRKDLQKELDDLKANYDQTRTTQPQTKP